MRCEVDYCIYNDNFKCYFDEVEINSLGMCEECQMVSLQEEELVKYKKKQFQEMIERF